jgi:hypothetical protein
MAENDNKTGADGNTFERRRPDILRAKDIIPSSGYKENRETGNQGFEIPQFNLAQDIMAAQRRQSAVRRKGPATEDGRRKTEDGGRKTEDRGQRTEDGRRKTEDGGRKTEDGRQKTEDGRQRANIRYPSSVIRHLTEWDAIIADIVARDIERLCGFRCESSPPKADEFVR